MKDIDKDTKDNKSLDNIKSKYIIQIVFSYLNEEIKLKLMQYNKNLQNKIDIQLRNYKFFSGKYIIYEKDGLGKEYDAYKDKLLFEGELLDKKRKKGKEYFSDYLIYEGEYKNGNKWNGKGFNGYNKVVYELINGNGHVKEYKFGRLGSEGEYLKGQKHGEWKEYNSYQTLLFVGEYLNGKRNGKGKEYDNQKGKLIFEGEYKNDNRWNGKGYDEKNNIVYELKNGNGYIKEYDGWKLKFE